MVKESFPPDTQTKILSPSSIISKSAIALATERLSFLFNLFFSKRISTIPIFAGNPLGFCFSDFFKTLLLLVLFVFPLPSFSGVVLLYHHVADDTPALTSIKTAQFERHLETIEESGYEVVPLEILTQTSLKSFRLDKKLSIVMAFPELS